MATTLAPPALSFKRKVITDTSACARGCLLVYPVSKKAKQRVAVGDSTGLFKVFSIGKRLDPVPAFGTPETAAQPGDSGAQKEKKAITAATLFSDQLFFIQGSMLHAYSRKGKAFFTVDTNVTERVHALAIDTPFIFLAGDFMVTTMSEVKELGFFLSPDRVNDMCVYVVPSAAGRKGERQLEDYVSCLACNDRVLRLVQSNKLMDEVGCEAALTAVTYIAAARLVLYGTQSGSIGVMALRDNGGLRKVGTCMPDGTGGAITCFGIADVNADNTDELLVGYDDGTVRVFAMQLQPPPSSSASTATPPASTNALQAVQLVPVWSGNVGERVMSVAGGIITHTAAQPDVLVHTFSGQVVAFTLDTDGPREDVQAAAAEAAAKQAALLAKQQDTEAEIEQLRRLVAQRTQELSVAPVLREKQAAPVLTVSASFKVSLGLTPIEGSPMLSFVIAADAPLDGALVQCNGALSFVSTDTAAVKTRPVAPPLAGTAPMSALSHSSLNMGAGPSAAIATITPTQRGSRRLEVHLWVDEGVADTLRVTVYSAQTPRTAQVKYLPLCALPLYERVSATDPSLLAGDVAMSMSRLIVLGNFQGQDALGWLGELLPGVADAPRRADEHQRFVFTSSFLHSVLTVDVEDDQEAEAGAAGGSRLLFACNSLVTLATVKRHLVAVCAERGMRVSTREHILCQTVLQQLRELYPIMSSLSNSQRQWQLLQGLRELQGAETNLTFLPRHFQEVLASAEEVQVEAEAEEHHAAHLKRAVAAMYRSFVYFKGHAPLFSESMRARLETASCGLGFDPATLEALFYPGNVSLQEAAAQEVAAKTPTSVPATPRANTAVHSSANTSTFAQAETTAPLITAAGAGVDDDGGGGGGAYDELSSPSASDREL